MKVLPDRCKNFAPPRSGQVWPRGTKDRPCGQHIAEGQQRVGVIGKFREYSLMWLHEV